MVGIVPHSTSRGATTLARVARGVHPGFGDLDGLANAQSTFDGFGLMADAGRHVKKSEINLSFATHDVGHPLVVDPGTTNGGPGIVPVQHVPQHL